MKRRDFTRRLALLATGGTQVLLTLEARGDFDSPAEVSIDLADPRYAALLEPGGAVKVEVEGYTYPVIVVRLDAERLTAFSSCCTHWGCEVELPDEEGIIYCLCHASRFDTEGKLLDGVAFGDLLAVELEVQAPTAVQRQSWGQVKEGS